jgi:hypothetical protein
VAITAQTFGVRPSALLEIRDPVQAFQLDEALAARLLDHVATSRAGPKAAGPAPGLRYERPGDFLPPELARRARVN